MDMEEWSFDQRTNPEDKPPREAAPDSFLPSTSCLAFNTKFTNYTKGKTHSLKRRSKYQSKFRYDRDVVVIRLGILTVVSNSLVVQQLGLLTSTERAWVQSPDRGTKAPEALQCGQKTREKSRGLNVLKV